MIFGFELAFITVGVLCVIAGVAYLLHSVGKDRREDDDRI